MNVTRTVRAVLGTHVTLLWWVLHNPVAAMGSKCAISQATAIVRVAGWFIGRTVVALFGRVLSNPISAIGSQGTIRVAPTVSTCVHIRTVVTLFRWFYDAVATARRFGADRAAGTCRTVTLLACGCGARSARRPCHAIDNRIPADAKILPTGCGRTSVDAGNATHSGSSSLLSDQWSVATHGGKWTVETRGVTAGRFGNTVVNAAG